MSAEEKYHKCGKQLTVSIAAYNVEAYLAETLESLAVPEILGELEVLVIDDGSTDSTGEIARKYEEKYPGTFRLISKENGGYGSTINRGLMEASGRYFKQLDGDDSFSGDLADFICLLRERSEDLIITRVIRRSEKDGNETVRDYAPDMPEGSCLFSEADIPDILTMHSVTFRTDFLREKWRPITEHCVYTDLEYVTYPLVRVKTAYIVHRPLYVYRIGVEGQSISAAGIRKHYREHQKVLVHLCCAYRDHASDLCGTADSVIRTRLRLETVMHMKYLCMLDVTPGHFAEFRRFLHRMGESFPDILADTAESSGFARLAVKSGGFMYPLLTALVRVSS